MVNREIYPALSKEITTKEILVLTGPRQVGKTTAVRWLINNVKNSIYIDLTLASARELFVHKDYNNIILSLENEGLNFGKHVTIAIDEIQYVKNLPEIVKYLYDNYDIKFILTGSSAYYLKNHFNESLAGRKLIYELVQDQFSVLNPFHFLIFLFHFLNS
ncbi:MAG: AAA family ATPase [Bifidobacteriaceae bacterium]|jgi:predicted AAA+ superfamily ATPase|nr:AAA family ATPase [Bifidobacteriaceae bacterium]